jgi:hypothetical protein
MLNIQSSACWNVSLAYLKSKDTESEEGHTGGLQNRPLSEKPGNSFSRARLRSILTGTEMEVTTMRLHSFTSDSARRALGVAGS